MKRYALLTFGCQMNVHDSQRLEELLRGAGYEAVEEASQADVVVLNTCSVREKAEQKLRSEAGRLKRLDALLVVAGCVAQQEGEKLLREMPFVDAVVGPDNLAELPALLRHLETGGAPLARTVFDTEAPQFLTAAAEPGTVGTSAYVTTMKGCDERCSFCIVPHTRGPERYRPSSEILAEVRRLVDAGAREVVLLGQTVNSYRDPEGALPEPAALDADEEPGDASQFAALLRAIAKGTPGLLRLRYTSPHPRHLTADLCAAHGELDVLAAHVHMPVQSGSDRVLKRMIRRYRREEYLRRLERLRAARPGLTLTSDVIVGFPGETDEDFQQTLSLVAEARFAGLFGFKYSPRPYTPALKLQDDVPEAVKQARLEALFAQSEAQLREHLRSLVGSQALVLVEGPSRPGARTLVGRSERNELVHFEPVEGARPGALLRCEVSAAHKHSLEGRALGVERLAPSSAPVSMVKRRSLAVLAEG